MSEKHGWASPAPAGLVALGIACFTFYASLSGSVGPGAAPLMGCWLIGGFVIQFVVGVLELKEGNLTGGNVFLFFSAFFMLTGGLEMFVKFFASVNSWKLDARIDGWAWLVLLIILVFYAFAYYRQTAFVMNILVTLLTGAVFFIAFIDLQWIDGSVRMIPAYLLLVAGFVAIYMSAAIILNSAYEKSILPVGKPILGKKTS